MSLPTTSLDPPATGPDTTTARRLRGLLPTGMLAGAAAAVATVVVAASAQAADVSLEVDGEAIPLPAFALWTIVAAFAGVVLAAVVRHRRRFLAAALTLTALSIVPAIVIPDDTATTVVLIGAHLLAAAIIIPAISSRLPTEN
jgi:hypothetical protein